MRLLVLYGSQTGTAQDVAEQIWRESHQLGFQGPVLSFEEYEMSKLIEERLVVFVVATTGDGVEPDNMKLAWRFLLKRSLPAQSLQEMQFACLGLGDSSYPKFNYAAKKLSKRLQNLGATAVCPVGLCDDQHDYGHLGVSLAWTKDLWAALKGISGLDESKLNISNQAIGKWLVRELPKDSHIAPLETLLWTQKQPSHWVCALVNSFVMALSRWRSCFCGLLACFSSSWARQSCILRKGAAQTMHSTRLSAPSPGGGATSEAGPDISAKTRFNYFRYQLGLFYIIDLGVFLQM